jgi:16S rRNA (adenine1518-N6/adenine1519-N6)-dimethyltransferase
VANLPYNVGTELLVRWLRADWPPWWSRLTLMFQKEVAERIVAAPRTPAYGRLAVLANWRTEARILFDVSPRAFTPPPKVTSAIVGLAPHDPPPTACEMADLERVTQAAFGQRRKMLRGALKSLTSEPEALLTSVGIMPTRRAETLSIAEFERIAAATAT